MRTYKEFIFESQEVLNKISSAWERKHPGMKLHVYNDQSGDINLHSLEVPKHKRGQGIGSRAMKGLANYADRQNKRITLTQQAEKGYKGKLDKFYRDKGFRPNKGRNKDYTTSAGMIRNPSGGKK
jgi:GNAT superfamily N-acetyltransferase